MKRKFEEEPTNSDDDILGLQDEENDSIPPPKLKRANAIVLTLWGQSDPERIQKIQTAIDDNFKKQQENKPVHSEMFKKVRKLKTKNRTSPLPLVPIFKSKT